MYRFAFLFLLLALVLFACSLASSNSGEPVVTEIPQVPSATFTPLPSEAPEPSPTLEPVPSPAETQAAHAHSGDSLEAITGAFSHEHLEAGPHLELAGQPEPSPEDVQRAEEIAEEARREFGKYSDYREALKDGYVIFAPEVPQEVYHFINYREALVNLYQTGPARPTALLYRKLDGGWQFEGVMYSAPLGSTEAELDSRYPLSMGQWHAHVNICLPKQVNDVSALASDPKFGLEGSIDSLEECEAEGGRFLPDLFGWMVHVAL